ncbi:MAG: V4R domain-containing protein [Promethearchaeota archaeon]
MLEASDETSDLVSIVLFKGKKCLNCRPVEKLLNDILRRTPDIATMTIVDTDRHVELKEKHNVRSVPLVLINGKRILDGHQASEILGPGVAGGFEMMGEQMPGQVGIETLSATFGESLGAISGGQTGDMFNYLFNKMIEARIERADTKKIAEQKASMLMISEKSRYLETGKVELLRPTIGDYVHVGVLQNIVTSMLAISPQAGEYLYSAGQKMGQFGIGTSLVSKYNPTVYDQTETKGMFKEIVKGLVHLYSATSGSYPSFLASEAESIKIEGLTTSIQIKDSAFASNVSGLNEPLCHYLAGEMGGITEAMLGTKVAVVENSCWGLGDDYCEFHMAVGEDRPSIEKEREFLSDERRNNFQTCQNSISKNQYESMLMTKILRPKVGDWCHISLVQQALHALKFSDEFYSTLLYYAGAHLGHAGVDKATINQIIRKKKLIPPLEFEDGIKLVKSYFNHPTTVLSRMQSGAQARIIDDETATIDIFECATASGLDISLFQTEIGTEEKRATPKLLCDFTAGFIHGRLDIVLDEEVRVQETECHSTGADFCRFKVELD